MLLAGRGVLLEHQLPLLLEIVAQQSVVAGLEQQAHRGPFAQERVVAEEGHVGDQQVAEQLAQDGRLEDQLLLQPRVQAVVQPPGGDELADVSAGIAQVSATPLEVAEAAEPHIEALLGHVRRQRFDLHIRDRFCRPERPASESAGGSG